MAPSGGVTVGYSTSDGRGNDDDATHQLATSADYTAAAENATLSIAAGSRTGTVSIPTTEDTTYEGDHYFTLTLDSTSHFNVSKTAGSATGTITDAADTPTFAFSAASTRRRRGRRQPDADGCQDRRHPRGRHRQLRDHRRHRHRRKRLHRHHQPPTSTSRHPRRARPSPSASPTTAPTSRMNPSPWSLAAGAHARLGSAN